MIAPNCISPFAWTRLIGTIPTDTPAQKARVAKLERMTPRDIAPLAVYLASEDAAHVSGQIFGVRGKEIFVFSQPRPVRSVHHADGWTPEQLAEVFGGTLGHHLTPLESSAQYFSYDPLV